jgi:hypothetical protein
MFSKDVSSISEYNSKFESMKHDACGKVAAKTDGNKSNGLWKAGSTIKHLNTVSECS